MRILSIDRAKQKAKGPSHGGSPARGRNQIRAGSSTPDGSRLSPTPSLASGIFGAACAATSHAFASDISQTVFVLGSLPIPAAARTHARAAFAAFVLVAVLLAGFPSTALAASDVADPSPAQGAPATGASAAAPKWPGGREGRQDGTRPGPAPWGKAAAHGLRAAAAEEDGRGRPPWGGHCPWGANLAVRAAPPCAQHRRARSTAVRAAPPCAQHGQIFMHTSQARQITVRRLPTDLASPTRCTLREAGKRGLGS